MSGIAQLQCNAQKTLYDVYLKQHTAFCFIFDTNENMHEF